MSTTTTSRVTGVLVYRRLGLAISIDTRRDEKFLCLYVFRSLKERSAWDIMRV